MDSKIIWLFLLIFVNSFSISMDNIEELRKATENNPYDSRLWFFLGEALQYKDTIHHEGGTNQKPAVVAYQKALSLNPDEALRASIYSKLGLVYYMMGQPIQALTSFNNLLKIKDLKTEKKVQGLYHKAISLQMLGNVIDAVAILREALVLNPYYFPAYRPIVECTKELGHIPREYWKQLEFEITKALKHVYPQIFPVSTPSKSISQINLEVLAMDEKMSVDLFYALFSVYDALNDQTTAWMYLTTGHFISKYRKPKFNQLHTEKNTDNIINIFHQNFWPSTTLVGSPFVTPIFIIGMMRSGSTLLEQILDSHSQISGAGEDSIFNGRLPVIRDEIVKSIKQGVLELKKVVDKHALEVVYKMFEKVETLGKNKGNSKDTKKKTPERIVDKMLFNFRNVGFIHLLFPKAIIINVIRDPLDTLFSCLKNKFDDEGLTFSLDVDHLVGEYISYLKLMHHWKTVLRRRITTIHYEDLIYNTEKISHDLIVDKIKLNWDPKVLEFHTSKRSVLTNSMSQVRHGISDKSIGNWKKYKAQLEYLIKTLKPKLEELKFKKALPLKDKVNWDLEDDFDYCDKLDCSGFRKSIHESDL